MAIQRVALEDLLAVARGSVVEPPWPTSGFADVVVVDLDAATGADAGEACLHTGVPAVVVGLTATAPPERHPLASVCDVVFNPDDRLVDDLVEQVSSRPVAAGALVRLLRGAEGRSIEDGLLVESAVYSTLQAGPEFVAWRAARPLKTRREEGDPVELRRDGDVLHVTLRREHVHNALDRAMRDQLVDAFRLVAVDGSITRVEFRGRGPSFCAGGDLDEFGTFPDPATAHLVRLQQSAGRAIAAVAGRVTVHLHGACMGSGIELAAFAGTVIAHPSTVVGLPEVSVGLVPGAGGTVSLPRRVGRHRTARLALTGERIDADTALSWGLVDRLEEG